MDISGYITVKSLVLLASSVATLYAWFRIFRSKEHWIFKIIYFLIVIFPVVGPFCYFFLYNPPEKQPVHMRATLNHYGTGGRFSGGGTRRFNYDPTDDQIEQLQKEACRKRQAKAKGKKKK